MPLETQKISVPPQITEVVTPPPETEPSPEPIYHGLVTELSNILTSPEISVEEIREITSELKNVREILAAGVMLKNAAQVYNPELNFLKFKEALFKLEEHLNKETDPEKAALLRLRLEAGKKLSNQDKERLFKSLTELSATLIKDAASKSRKPGKPDNGTKAQANNQLEANKTRLEKDPEIIKKAKELEDEMRVVDEALVEIQKQKIDASGVIDRKTIERNGGASLLLSAAYYEGPQVIFNDAVKIAQHLTKRASNPEISPSDRLAIISEISDLKNLYELAKRGLGVGAEKADAEKANDLLEDLGRAQVEIRNHNPELVAERDVEQMLSLDKLQGPVEGLGDNLVPLRTHEEAIINQMRIYLRAINFEKLPTSLQEKIQPLLKKYSLVKQSAVDDLDL